MSMEKQNKAEINFTSFSLDEKTSEIQQSIAEKSKIELFHYPNYTIEAPELRSRNLKHNLKNKLFVSPNLDETELVSYEQNGRALKRLNEKQKSDLRNTGQFGVPSVLFPDNEHVWRVSEIFQKGKRKMLSTFYVWVANAYK